MTAHEHGCTDGVAENLTSTIENGGTNCSGIIVPPNVREIALAFPAEFTGGDVQLKISLDGGSTWLFVVPPGNPTAPKITDTAAAGRYVLVGWMVLPCQSGGGTNEYVPIKVRTEVAAQAAARTLTWILWKRK
jgi:hypothetical protein